MIKHPKKTFHTISIVFDQQLFKELSWIFPGDILRCHMCSGLYPHRHVFIALDSTCQREGPPVTLVPWVDAEDPLKNSQWKLVEKGRMYAGCVFVDFSVGKKGSMHTPGIGFEHIVVKTFLTPKRHLSVQVFTFQYPTGWTAPFMTWSQGNLCGSHTGDATSFRGEK